MRYVFSVFILFFFFCNESIGKCTVLGSQETNEVEKIILHCPESNTERELRNDVDSFSQSRSTAPRVSIIVAAPELLTLRFAANDFEPGGQSDDGIMAIIREHDNSTYSQLSMKEVIIRRLRIGPEIQYAFCCSTLAANGSLDVAVTGATFTYDHRPTPKNKGDMPVSLLWISQILPAMIQYSHLKMFGYTAGKPTCSQCDTLLREVFNSRTPNYSDISIRIRNDLWFDGPGYPLVFKFAPAAWADHPYLRREPGRFRLPRIHEYYYLRREVWCRLLKHRKGLSCEVSGRWNIGDLLGIQAQQ
jgi:hypothetical protein